MVLDEDDVALQQQREFRVVKIFGTKGFSIGICYRSLTFWFMRSLVILQVVRDAAAEILEHLDLTEDFVWGERIGETATTVDASHQ